MGDVPAGLYENLVTTFLERRLAEVEPELRQLENLDPADAHEALARHITELARRALRAAGREDPWGLAAQIRVANDIVAAITALAPSDMGDEEVLTPGRRLLAVAEDDGVPGSVVFPQRPAVPLSTSALLVNGRGQPRGAGRR